MGAVSLNGNPASHMTEKTNQNAFSILQLKKLRISYQINTSMHNPQIPVNIQIVTQVVCNLSINIQHLNFKMFTNLHININFIWNNEELPDQ
jgi:hypothetical protein